MDNKPLNRQDMKESIRQPKQHNSQHSNSPELQFNKPLPSPRSGIQMTQEQSAYQQKLQEVQRQSELKEQEFQQREMEYQERIQAMNQFIQNRDLTESYNSFIFSQSKKSLNIPRDDSPQPQDGNPSQASAYKDPYSHSKQRQIIQLSSSPNSVSLHDLHSSQAYNKTKHHFQTPRMTSNQLETKFGKAPQEQYRDLSQTEFRKLKQQAHHYRQMFDNQLPSTSKIDSKKNQSQMLTNSQKQELANKVGQQNKSVTLQTGLIQNPDAPHITRPFSQMTKSQKKTKLGQVKNIQIDLSHIKFKTARTSEQGSSKKWLGEQINKVQDFFKNKLYDKSYVETIQNEKSTPCQEGQDNSNSASADDNVTQEFADQQVQHNVKENIKRYSQYSSPNALVQDQTNQRMKDNRFFSPRDQRQTTTDKNKIEIIPGKDSENQGRSRTPVQFKKHQKTNIEVKRTTQKLQASESQRITQATKKYLLNPASSQIDEGNKTNSQGSSSQRRSNEKRKNTSYFSNNKSSNRDHIIKKIDMYKIKQGRRQSRVSNFPVLEASPSRNSKREMLGQRIGNYTARGPIRKQSIFENISSQIPNKAKEVDDEEFQLKKEEFREYKMNFLNNQDEIPDSPTEREILHKPPQNLNLQIKPTKFSKQDSSSQPDEILETNHNLKHQHVNLFENTKKQNIKLQPDIIKQPSSQPSESNNLNLEDYFYGEENVRESLVSASSNVKEDANSSTMNAYNRLSIAQQSNATVKVKNKRESISMNTKSLESSSNPPWLKQPSSISSEPKNISKQISADSVTIRKSNLVLDVQNVDLGQNEQHRNFQRFSGLQKITSNDSDVESSKSFQGITEQRDPDSSFARDSNCQSIFINDSQKYFNNPSVIENNQNQEDNTNNQNLKVSNPMIAIPKSIRNSAQPQIQSPTSPGGEQLQFTFQQRKRGMTLKVPSSEDQIVDDDVDENINANAKNNITLGSPKVSKLKNRVKNANYQFLQKSSQQNDLQHIQNLCGSIVGHKMNFLKMLPQSSGKTNKGLTLEHQNTQFSFANPIMLSSFNMNQLNKANKSYVSTPKQGGGPMQIIESYDDNDENKFKVIKEENRLSKQKLNELSYNETIKSKDKQQGIIQYQQIFSPLNQQQDQDTELRSSTIRTEEETKTHLLADFDSQNPDLLKPNIQKATKLTQFQSPVKDIVEAASANEDKERTPRSTVGSILNIQNLGQQISELKNKLSIIPKASPFLEDPQNQQQRFSSANSIPFENENTGTQVTTSQVPLFDSVYNNEAKIDQLNQQQADSHIIPYVPSQLVKKQVRASQKELRAGPLSPRANQNLSDYIKIKKQINQQIGKFQRFRKNRSKRLFEQFYVAGINEEDLEQCVGEDPTSAGIGEQSDAGYFIPCKFVYKYPQVAQLKQVELRSKSIQDFVFPNGVFCQPLPDFDSPEGQEKMNVMLYQSPNNRQNTFIFTVVDEQLTASENSDSDTDPSAAPPSEQQQSQIGLDNYFNCICIQFNTFMKRKSDDKYFIVQQALCMLSRNNFFPPQFDVLDKTLQLIYQHRKINQIYLQDILNITPGDSLQKYQFFIIDYSDQQYYTSIQELYKQKFKYFKTADDIGSTKFPFNNRIDVKLFFSKQESKVPVLYKYQFPDNIKDFQEYSFHWHAPLVLAMFKDLKSILKLMTAIFLEKSIIFVSKYPTRLTSAMRGLKSMIRPFGWCHTLIPILPGQLLEYIDCPCPILCGITLQSYIQLQEMYDLEQDFDDSFTWVYLDQEDISLQKDIMHDPELQLTGMKWCSGKEAMEYEQSTWFLEYPGFEDLIKLHQQLLSKTINLKDESFDSPQDYENNYENSLIYQATPEQDQIIKEFKYKLDEMIALQILSYIDIIKMKEIYKGVNTTDSYQVATLFSRYAKMVLDECKNQETLLQDQIQQSQLCQISQLENNQDTSLTTPKKKNNIPDQNINSPSEVLDPTFYSQNPSSQINDSSVLSINSQQQKPVMQKNQSVAFLKRMSILQQQQQIILKEQQNLNYIASPIKESQNEQIKRLENDIRELSGSPADVYPFLESLVQTQSFQQLIQDLIS